MIIDTLRVWEFYVSSFAFAGANGDEREPKTCTECLFLQDGGWISGGSLAAKKQSCPSVPSRISLISRITVLAAVIPFREVFSFSG
jgi:hypothetical protein